MIRTAKEIAESPKEKISPTHYCPTLRCKMMPERCQQRKQTKNRLKNPYMTEYSAYFRDCRDCKGPVKLENVNAG